MPKGNIYIASYLDCILTVVNIGECHIADICVGVHVHPGVVEVRSGHNAVDLERAFALEDLKHLRGCDGHSVTKSKAGSSYRSVRHVLNMILSRGRSWNLRGQKKR